MHSWVQAMAALEWVARRVAGKPSRGSASPSHRLSTLAMVENGERKWIMGPGLAGW